jgi:bla regulator protein BlaR1
LSGGSTYSVFLRQCQSIDERELEVEGVVEAARDRGKGKLGKASIRFLRSESLATPFCWQFHQPYIVLPAFLLKGHDKELNLIVRHELEHLFTGHPLQLFIQRVVEIVFWFHPMIWWASQQSSLAREFACDEAAVSEPSEIAAYLRSLLEIVERVDVNSSEGPTGLAFGGTKSIIAERARRLVRRAKGEAEGGRPKIGDAGALAGLICLVAVTALLWLPVDVLASPQSNWSPWPRWTSAILHDMGVPARDFDRYDNRFQLRDLLDSEDEDVSDRNVSATGR